MRIAFFLALALLAPRGAEAGSRRCETLEEAEFRGRVFDAQAALDRDDPESLASVVDELRTRVPCLAFAPAPRLWADFLVLWSLSEFGRSGDWSEPLAAAIRTHPSVDRGVGLGHPVAIWEAPPAEKPVPEGDVVPENLEIFVDGTRSSRFPPIDGLRLVQRVDSGFWFTVLLDDEPVPDWMVERHLEPPPHLLTWASAGIALGLSTSEQSPGWSSAYIPETHAVSPSGGVYAHGVALYVPHVGFWGEVLGSRSTTGARIDADIAAVRSGRGLTIGVGMAARTAEVTEGTVRRVAPYLTPLAVGDLRRGKAEIRLAAGAGLAGWHAALKGSLAVSGPWRIGGDVRIGQAWFLQGGDPTRVARMDQGQAVVLIERSFGQHLENVR